MYLHYSSNTLHEIFVYTQVVLIYEYKYTITL